MHCDLPSWHGSGTRRAFRMAQRMRRVREAAGLQDGRGEQQRQRVQGLKGFLVARSGHRCQPGKQHCRHLKNECCRAADSSQPEASRRRSACAPPGGRQCDRPIDNVWIRPLRWRLQAGRRDDGETIGGHRGLWLLQPLGVLKPT